MPVAVPEGLTAEHVIDCLTNSNRPSLEKLNLKPGESAK
jgi:hypothetical protein